VCDCMRRGNEQEAELLLGSEVRNVRGIKSACKLIAKNDIIDRSALPSNYKQL
jgi:hypothetical protein